jgi:hypothetical protein
MNDQILSVLKQLTTAYRRYHLNQKQWIGNPFECPGCRLIERAEDLIAELEELEEWVRMADEAEQEGKDEKDQ